MVDRDADVFGQGTNAPICYQQRVKSELSQHSELPEGAFKGLLCSTNVLRRAQGYCQLDCN